jgi:predicted phosphodiesterase
MSVPDLELFAVEDRSAQLTWAELDTDELTVEIGDQIVTVDAPPPAWLHWRGRRSRPLAAGRGGPGALSVTGLSPDTSYEICVSGPSMARHVVGQLRTLAPPPGKLLARFATISDLHVGERGFGLLGRIEDRRSAQDPGEAYPLRAARAAIGEATAWGAQLLIVKGDLTHHARPAEFRQAAQLLRAADVPVEVALGNHDVRRHLDTAALLSAAGITTGDAARARDIPGARIVLGHTPTPRDHAGDVEAARADELAALAGAARGPAIVVVHHPPQRWPIRTSYPPGIPYRQSAHLMRQLRRANPDVIVLAGHSHRNRLYTVGGIVVAEVGSTKDFPGQWAGYAVHEGGIRQVVRRVARPDVLAWTQSTRRAYGGLWGHWSPGTLADRCWVHRWRDPVALDS